jgi:hypothetical protein
MSLLFNKINKVSLLFRNINEMINEFIRRSIVPNSEQIVLL